MVCEDDQIKEKKIKIIAKLEDLDIEQLENINDYLHNVINIE